MVFHEISVQSLQFKLSMNTDDTCFTRYLASLAWLGKTAIAMALVSRCFTFPTDMFTHRTVC